MNEEKGWVGGGGGGKQTVQRQSLIISHEQTDAQRVSKQWLPPRPASLINMYWETWCCMTRSIDLVTSGHLSRLSPLPAFPLHSLLPGSGAEWVTEKVLMLHKHCSAIARTLVCNQHCLVTNPKHSTIQTAMKKVKSMTAICICTSTAEKTDFNYSLFMRITAVKIQDIFLIMSGCLKKAQKLEHSVCF